jgi:DNA modification methylase
LSKSGISGIILRMASAKPSALLDTRVIYCGDNLEQLKKLPDACVDLIYIDPPFNSNRNYEVFWGETKEKRAFVDRHKDTDAYIDYMRPRCVALARVLKKTGSFYYHCDWHASHYVKVMLDRIFGENNFRNEIIWRRTTAKTQSYNQFPNNHDSIFFYTGGGETTFHRQFVPLSEERIAKHYGHVDEKTGRRYSLSDLTGEGIRNGETGKPWRGFDPTPKQRHWARPPEDLDKLDTEGKIYWPEREGAWPRIKRFLDEQDGVLIDTIWSDIPPINSQAHEALGYPTQKPLALLERIIQSSSNENDIVLDAFCGCGTALVAAQKLKRQWIGIDVSPTACRVMAKRLRDKNICCLPEDEKLWGIGRGFIVRDLPKTEVELRKYPPFEFENWAVVALGGIPNKTQVGDLGIDGRIYPVSAMPERRGKGTGELEFMDTWYPIQVKQTDKVGREDIDAFETAMQRKERKLGYFVGFDFTSGALFEIDRFRRTTGCEIKPLTVREILDEEIARKLA